MGYDGWLTLTMLRWIRICTISFAAECHFQAFAMSYMYVVWLQNWHALHFLECLTCHPSISYSFLIIPLSLGKVQAKLKSVLNFLHTTFQTWYQIVYPKRSDLICMVDHSYFAIPAKNNIYRVSTKFINLLHWYNHVINNNQVNLK